ncbi:MAG: hypothetical protein ACWGON_06660 [Gemmatimonadota bacterium]
MNDSNDHASVLPSLADRLDLPQPARSRVLIEVAADLEDLEALYVERGSSPEQARERALERLDLSDYAIAELVRVHGSPLRRGLDRLGESGRRRGERVALGALVAFLFLVTRALIPTRDLLTDAGQGLWIIAALVIPGLLLAASRIYALWGRDEHDPRRLRRGLDTILALGCLSAASGLTVWWVGLRRVATASAAKPDAAMAYLVEWLTGGSALVVASFQGAILLGILWLILSGRAAQVERGEAELLLLEERARTRGGE